MQKQLTDIFSSMGRLFNTPMELNAIWLNHTVNTGEGRKARICPDMHVWVKDGAIVEGEGEPTHLVLATRGTLAYQFEMDLCEIDNPNNLITIKL
jgi:hypothetical protein